MNALLSRVGGGGGGSGGGGAARGGGTGSGSGSEAVASDGGGLMNMTITTTTGRVATGVAVVVGVGAAAYLAHRYLYLHRDAAGEVAARWRRRRQQHTESKVLYLIRHGQSTFNAAYETSGIDPMLFDAPLSALGKRQVMALNASVVASVVGEGGGRGIGMMGGGGGNDDDDDDDDGDRGGGGGGGGDGRGCCLNPVPEVVLVSPLTRALQTAVGSFANTGIPMEVMPDLREHLTESCDVGRPTRELRSEFPSVSFSALLINPNTTNHRDRDASPSSSASASTASASSSLAQQQPSQKSVVGGGGEGGLWSEVWWYVDPEAEPPGAHMDPAEACRRDFMTYGFVEPESEARRRVSAVLDAVRRRPEKTVALVGHSDFFNMLAAVLDPRAAEELWLDNCGVASYTLPPLPPALRSMHVTRAYSPGVAGSAAA